MPKHVQERQGNEMTDVDDGLIINPLCPGVCLQFNIQLQWNGQVRLDIMNFEINPQSQRFIGNVFNAVSQMLLAERDE